MDTITRPSWQIEAARQMRRESGLGMMNCIKALIENDWDVEAAQEWVRAMDRDRYERWIGMRW